MGDAALSIITGRLRSFVLEDNFVVFLIAVSSSSSMSLSVLDGLQFEQ